LLTPPAIYTLALAEVPAAFWRWCNPLLRAKLSHFVRSPSVLSSASTLARYCKYVANIDMEGIPITSKRLC